MRSIVFDPLGAEENLFRLACKLHHLRYEVELNPIEKLSFDVETRM
jgi:hypothetical protein